MLVDARERYSQGFVIVKVAASDDGNIFGYPEALVHGLVHGSHCHRIVEAEHPIRNALAAQELPHGFRTALDGPDIAFGLEDHILIDNVFPALSKCSLVSLEPLDAGTCLRSLNMGDSFATDIH